LNTINVLFGRFVGASDKFGGRAKISYGNEEYFLKGGFDKHRKKG
jgi:hypothetical protein